MHPDLTATVSRYENSMPADAVCDNLFLGDAASSMAPDVAAYDLIVNVTREVPFSKCLRSDQETARFDILDDDASDQQAMANVCVSAATLIDTALSAGKKVLVHCLEGKQRSATVAAAFLIRKGLPPILAIEHVHAARSAAWDHGQYIHYRDALDMFATSEMSNLA